MAQVITITSGKGGVGKSTATANLAVGLAMEVEKESKKVVAVDFDIGLRNLDMLLGLENRIVYDVIDVMEGKCNLSQALINHKKTKNLYFLPASQTKDKTILDKDKVGKLIESLRENFDYILIDSPAGIESGFEHAILYADRALIIVTPEVSSVRDSDRVIGIIDAKSIKAQNGEEVQKHATNTGEPVIYTQAPSAKAYMRIAKRILGEKVEFVSFENESGVMGALKRIFQ